MTLYALAEHLHLTLEQVFELTLTEIHGWIIYLKAKHDPYRQL
jgi:hypothetical protein